MKPRRKRSKSPAAREKKRAMHYLAPLPAGAGYRFNPGPGLRKLGCASAVLEGYKLEQAQAHRDAAIDAARANTPPPARPKGAVEDRTLDALWKLYEKETRAAIEANAARQADERDPDVISAETLRQYTSLIKPWLAFAGDAPAAALDADIIQAEYKAQRFGLAGDPAAGIAPRLARGHSAAHASYRSLMALLAFGKRKKWFAVNAASGLRLAPPQGRLRLGLPEEIKALVETFDAMTTTVSDVPGRVIADGVVAALWSGQRQQDLLACDLGQQMRGGFLQFARTHHGDFSQKKTRGRVSDGGGQANVKVLPPLALRLRARTTGLLLPGPDNKQISSDTFQRAFAKGRERAAEKCAGVADLQFRDLRDTAVTRLHMAKTPITDIALWTGHSLKSIEQILRDHYLVATRDAAETVADNLEAWRQKTGVMW